MKFSRILLFALLLPVFLLGGCGSVIGVDADYRPEFDFIGLQSYAWLEPASPPSVDIRIDNDLYKDRVVAAVEKALRAKGLVKEQDGRPDFFVTWFGAIDKKIRAETINYFYSRYWGDRNYGLYGPWGGGFSTTQVYEYEVGTLIIDFLTPEQKRLFWRGTGQSYVEQGRSPEEITESVENTVSAILEQFPPLPEQNN